MRTYLVTGGAGFIGSNYIHYMFKKYDNEIRFINVDKLTYAGNLENLKDIEDRENYTFVKADICDADAINKIFEENEIDEFVSKLQKNELVQFRDVHEKNAIIQKIRTEYKSDPFISLVKLVSNGVHIDNLRDAYFELSPDCKEAFIYTALLHRFSLLLSIGL